MSRYGSPDSIDELEKRRCLCYTNSAKSKLWSFRAVSPKAEPRTLSPRSVFTSNNDDALRDAAVQGVGLAVLPTFTVANDPAEGRLVRVLPGEEPDDDIIYAVYARNRFLSNKLRAFVEHVRLSLFLRPCEGLAAAGTCLVAA